MAIADNIILKFGRYSLCGYTVFCAVIEVRKKLCYTYIRFWQMPRFIILLQRQGFRKEILTMLQLVNIPYPPIGMLAKYTKD